MRSYKIPYQVKNLSKAITKRRMHSSRIRTARICLSACWDQPPLGVGLEDPPGVGLKTPPPARPLNIPSGVAWRHPLARPLNIPPGVGLETPFQPDPSTSPWVWAWRPPSARPLNIALGVGLDIPAREQND